ncbi:MULTISPECIES: carbohydrate kinase family protein [Streptomyces]|uniref:Carbohydrate kinase family protein n=1 Tax=Streptomyces doudnae TaxID=3075536 RepID=A0ABD5EHC4_9ACTN|nr:MULTISPECIES: carbohydrate kinase family protein [unclassified Streptomyces]MDT0433752.1 carbohydrate kinase family protein [Streptomyces sp. DSM 41981]MYQ62718.1 carbohydrate kinase family protein [Streptomyces sp. SID4950]SCD43067.1 Sugar or nucleoside kinase, ribokinase family [Streptomyces sp. SolWspMP-5a-2]
MTGVTYDLVVIGDVNPDVVVGPVTGLAFGQREQLVDHGRLVLGGSAAIMACGAARLGLRVAFAGRVGDDPAGAFVRGELADRGVDVSRLTVDPALPTPLTTILTTADGDRAILTAPGCLTATGPADVPSDLLAATRHVHAASFFLMPRLAAGLAALFDRARAHGATTSLDTNDDPAARWDRALLDPVLKATDVLLPNAAEALALSGDSRVTDAAATLAGHGPTVVVKDGARGALARHGDETLRVAAVPVEPLDAVGAGDSFDAGFVAARLRGLGLRASLAMAAACGSLSTRAHGGTAAQPTWDEAWAVTDLKGTR